jgi:hypothetical protein
MTKLSRWVGTLEVIEGPYEDKSPWIYDDRDDPFVVRFRVRPLVWLEKERAVPIRDDSVWNALSFTRGVDKSGSSWTGKLRASLAEIDQRDALFLEALLTQQAADGRAYPVDEREYQSFVRQRIRRVDRAVAVTVPSDERQTSEPPPVADTDSEIRQSIRMQALVAEVGSKMGHNIWIPRSDRARVEALLTGDRLALLDILPLNYDDTTLRTIENIDVLWLKGRAIVRAFEVEHSTSVYSGILRMADLLALQPNMDIKLHIVAPGSRRDKVFQEIQRPVFSLLDRGPLAESCSLLSYESLTDLAKQPHLSHYNDSVLDEYAEYAEEAD